MIANEWIDGSPTSEVVCRANCLFYPHLQGQNCAVVGIKMSFKEVDPIHILPKGQKINSTFVKISHVSVDSRQHFNIRIHVSFEHTDVYDERAIWGQPEVTLVLDSQAVRPDCLMPKYLSFLQGPNS